MYWYEIFAYIATGYAAMWMIGGWLIIFIILGVVLWKDGWDGLLGLLLMFISVWVWFKLSDLYKRSNEKAAEKGRLTKKNG